MTLAIVAGAIANKPGNGGAAWTRLSWLAGLRQVGFEVHFVEQLASGLGPEAEAWFSSVLRPFGLDRAATLLREDGSTASGLSRPELGELAAEASLLINLSGHLTVPDVHERIRCRVFVDLDPGYTQVWHVRGFAPLQWHDHWYTVGTRIGSTGCRVPTGGLPWRPTLQPVDLAEWPLAASGPSPDRFTTVAAWRGYGPVEHEGEVWGPKAHELRRFASLPSHVPARLELALEIHPDDGDDRAMLERQGWKLVDPRYVAGDPFAFRSFVQSSRAELSVAQAAYTRSRSGWFSDRTARYLASGRPAIVQDTGLSEDIPTGEGLLTFRSLPEAVHAVEAVLADGDKHARAARALAERHLAGDVVLGRLCEEVGVAP